MKFKRLISYIKETKWEWLKSHSHIRVAKGGNCIIEQNVEIHDCNIFIDTGGSICIKRGVKLKHVLIYIKDGDMTINENVIITGKDVYPSEYTINNGTINIGCNSRLMCKKIWVRYGGTLKIGSYTNINYGSEIRADERIVIGSYTRISYNVNIWDTNTHIQYHPDIRRKLIEKYWPDYVIEPERPKTAPIVIGNDCWLGEQSTILKGTTLGDCVTVGYRTTIAGKDIAPNKTVVQNLEYKIISNS